ncbi:uncharacterized protein RJT21DRAFT_117149 [Scheffersomyces amazonensis]|uniref:uncharacterized protein n=1 Tax=Scheffersomyces amazonensis TaxID=1078765 RepID=UPI00315DA167
MAAHVVATSSSPDITNPQKAPLPTQTSLTNEFEFLIPKVNDTLNYIDSFVDSSDSPQTQIIPDEALLEEDIELELDPTKMKTINRLNSQFPFNNCTFDHLKDTPKSLALGLAGAFDAYMTSFKDNDNDEDNILEENDYDMENDNNNDNDEDFYYDLNEDHGVIIPLNRLNITDKHVQPLVSILKQSTNNDNNDTKRRSSSNSTPSLELSIITNKISSIIEEYFPTLINDEDFIEIKNYVINYLIIFLTKKDSNINSVVNLIIQKQYKLNLIEKIFEILIEKYETIKIDAFLDYFMDFNSTKSISDEKSVSNTNSINSSFITSLLNNPHFYDKYKIIWRLDNSNYKYYDKEYFIDDYFEMFNSLEHYNSDFNNNDETQFNRNGFVMNFDKFFVYYNRDVKADRLYDSEYDNEYDDDNFDYFAELSSSTSSHRSSSTSSTSSDSSVSSTSSTSSFANFNRHGYPDNKSGNRRISTASSVSTITTGTVTGPSTRSNSLQAKSLRFDDNIDVLNVDRYEPVSFLHGIKI